MKRAWFHAFLAMGLAVLAACAPSATPTATSAVVPIPTNEGVATVVSTATIGATPRPSITFVPTPKHAAIQTPA